MIYTSSLATHFSVPARLYVTARIFLSQESIHLHPSLGLPDLDFSREIFDHNRKPSPPLGTCALLFPVSIHKLESEQRSFTELPYLGKVSQYRVEELGRQ